MATKTSGPGAIDRLTWRWGQLIAPLLFALLVVSCTETSEGDDDDDGVGGGGTSTSTSTSTSSGTGGAAGGGGGAGLTGGGGSLNPDEPSYGSNSTFGDVHDMANWINSQRVQYQPHDRYWGIPFSNDHFHQNVTWPIQLQWDDTAAAIAQVEASAIANGAAPSLVSVEGGIIYLSAPCSAPFMLHTDEATMTSVNPFMRMGLYYHDFGGQGPVLTTIGVGAADRGNGETAWVVALTE